MQIKTVVFIVHMQHIVLFVHGKVQPCRSPIQTWLIKKNLWSKIAYIKINLAWILNTSLDHTIKCAILFLFTDTKKSQNIFLFTDRDAI